MEEQRLERICLYCGDPIDPRKQKTAVYCNEKCQKRAKARRQYVGELADISRSPRFGDAEVVSGEDFANILERWKEDYDRKHGINGRTDYESDGATPAFTWLEQETGYSQRNFYRWIKREVEYISAWRVDTMLTAMGLNHLLTDGTLHIIPSPRWSIEDWVHYMEERGCV